MEALVNQVLAELFKTDTEKAIEVATHLFIDQPYTDFDTWAEAEKSRVTEFSCHESWETSHIVVVCQTCAIGKNSGICVPCYLRGNHEGHSLLIDISNSGACDCGNSSCWNPKGFCQKHSHEVPDNPHLVDLGEKRSDYIGSIVLSAISALIPLSLNQKTIENVELICKFLINLASIGDAYRRIISLVFVDDYDFNDLLINWPRFTYEAANSIFKLLSELINDSVFINRFTTYFCDSFTYLVGVKVNTTYLNEGDYETELYFDETLPVDILLDISFYTWSYLSSHPNLFEFNNIPDLISRTLTIYTSLMGYNQRHKIVSSECMQSLLEYLGILINTEYFLNLLSDPDNQEILSSFLRSISLVEATPIVEISIKTKPEIMKCYCRIHHLLYTAFRPIVKVNVDSSVFFSVLSFYVLMNLIRDLVDHPSDATTSIWQRSVFTRGICLGCFLPLHYLSFEHFIMHTDDPVHDWGKIASAQNMEPEILLFGTTVLPLRSCAIASYISFGLSPTPKEINPSLNQEQAIRGRYGPVFCAAALLPEHDDFISMVLNTFGILDEPEYIIHPTLMHRRFAFFHLLTVILFDNSIFERTNHGILRSQAISLLQYGPMPISSILEALQSYEGNLDFSYELKSVLDEITFKIKQKEKMTEENDEEDEDKPSKKLSKSRIQVLPPKAQNKYKVPPLFKFRKAKNENSVFSENITNSSSSSSSSSSSLFDSDIPDFSLSPPLPNLYILKPQYKTVAPFNIWTSPSFAYQVVRSKVDLENLTLLDLDLHRIKEFPSGFDTSRILFSPCFFGACYITAIEADYRTDFTTVTLMLNLLLFVDKINDEPPCKESLALIKVQTYKQLCMIMPSSFQRFLRTPFQFKYHPPSTFLDIVRHLGPVGSNFINLLSKSGSNNSNNISNNANSKINKKKKADSAKFWITTEFTRQINSYLPKTVKIEVHQQCAICHKPTRVIELIPAFLYNFKMMPSGRISLRVALNGALYHSKCFFESKESMIYSNFILNDTNSVSKAFNSDLPKLIQTMADEIEILEIRLPRNPFIFRDAAPTMKLSYLFEAARVIAKKTKPNKNSNKNATNNSKSNVQNFFHAKFAPENEFIAKLILDLAFSKNAKEFFFDAFTSNFEKKKEKGENLTFSVLRQCAFVAYGISHVITSNQLEDLVTSYIKLCTFFGIKNRKEEDQVDRSNSSKTSENRKNSDANEEATTNKKDNENEDEKLPDNDNEEKRDKNDDIEATTNKSANKSADSASSKNINTESSNSNSNSNNITDSTNNSTNKNSESSNNSSCTNKGALSASNSSRSCSCSCFDSSIDVDEHPPSSYYPFISLPKNFLEFYAEPYSYDILNINCSISHLYLCLLTGKCLETDEVLDHLKEVKYSIFLVLSGCMAGAVCVMLDGHPELTKTVESPYVTIFGDEQFGMKDGQMLWYNEDRMWRLCDQFLDGTLLLPESVC